MEYRKPRKLVPLQLYLPYKSQDSSRRLISREQEFKFGYRGRSVQSTVSSKTCEVIKSFQRLNSRPSLLFTSFHQKQLIGKNKKPRKLPPLNSSIQDFPETSETNTLRPNSEVPMMDSISENSELGVKKSEENYLKQKEEIQKLSQNKNHQPGQTALEKELNQERPPSPLRVFFPKNKTTQLNSQVGKSSLCLKSIQIHFKEIKETILVPLEHLRLTVFAEPDQILSNVFKCTRAGYSPSWTARNDCETYFEQVPPNFMSPYFENPEKCLVLLETFWVQKRMIGTVVTSFEKKGLSLKCTKLLGDSKNPAVALCFRGPNAIALAQTISSQLSEQYGKSVYSSESQSTVHSDLVKYFTKEEVERMDYSCSVHKMSGSARLLRPVYSYGVSRVHTLDITLPTVKYESPLVKILRPVPLGLLKGLIDSNFEGWEKQVLDFLQKFEGISVSPLSKRSGLNFSSLKSTVDSQGRSVVLSLQAPEVLLSNSNVSAKYTFKMHELESLLAMAQRHKDQLVNELMKTAHLLKSRMRSRIIWKLTLSLQSLNFQGEFDEKYLSQTQEVQLNGEKLVCQLRKPFLEIYRPDTKKRIMRSLDSRVISALVKNNFENWEDLVYTSMPNSLVSTPISTNREN